MTYDEARQSYLEWLCSLVGVGEQYSVLMWHLNNVIFEPSALFPLDANRSSDGESLRWKWAVQCDIPQVIVAEYIDNCPCTIMEMMVALACRMEDDIMADPMYGDRTPLWFHDMIVSLGLESQTDDNFDSDYVGYVVNRFQTRQYEPNGKGGLFTLHNSADCRNAEIWYLMMWYLGERR